MSDAVHALDPETPAYRSPKEIAIATARAARADIHAAAWTDTPTKKHYCAVIPPSMTSSLPVTNDASSEARYSTP